jgi:hypothetical protein
MDLDETTLEVKAAVPSIVRKAEGKDWQAFLRELARREHAKPHRRRHDGAEKTRRCPMKNGGTRTIPTLGSSG